MQFAGGQCENKLRGDGAEKTRSDVVTGNGIAPWSQELAASQWTQLKVSPSGLAGNASLCGRIGARTTITFTGESARKLATQWHFVHIGHLCRARELDATFQRLVVNEFESASQPLDCRVYRRTSPGGGYTYLFSPGASTTLAQFVKFWGGVSCSEPTNLLDLEAVL